MKYGGKWLAEGKEPVSQAPSLDLPFAALIYDTIL